MEAYSLIARYKDSNEVEIIPIKEKWYLGKNGRDVKSNKVSLEALDLITTKFSSAEEMINQMYSNGYLKTPNVDLFIAKKLKRNNKEYIKTYEIIYNPSKKERIEDLRIIAYSYLSGLKDKVSILVDKVSNKLISKANSNEDFRNILICETTDVPNRLTDPFWKGTQNYSLKYQNKKTFENYTTIRSIIEALNRYDYLSTLKDDVFVANVNFLNENGSARKKIEPVLLEILDKNYLPGQYNFLDPNYSFNEQEEQMTKETSEEQTLPEIPNISYEEKRQEIIETFHQLPFSFLQLDKTKQKINPNFFSTDFPITAFEQEFLENLLPNSLALTLETYTAHKNEYYKALDNFSNTFLLENEIRLDENSIYKKLKNDKNLDKVYLWVLIYKRYLKRLQDFTENSSGKKAK